RVLASRLNGPAQRSLSTYSIGTSRHSASAARRKRTKATRVSCPSLKMSALTSTLAPTSRLTGYRPPSTVGATFSITTVRRINPLSIISFASTSVLAGSSPHSRRDSDDDGYRAGAAGVDGTRPRRPDGGRRAPMEPSPSGAANASAPSLHEVTL